MRSTLVLSLIAVAVLGFTGIFYRLDGATITYVGDLAPVILSFLAAIGWSIIAKNTAKELKYDKWARWCIALFLWTNFLGETAWAWYELVLGIQEPLSMLPDVFWHASYIFLIAGLIFYAKTVFIPRKAIIGYNLFFVSIAIARIAVEFARGTNFVNFIEALYIVWDIIALGLILMMLVPMAMSYNHIMNSWLLFLAGILGIVIFDMLFSAMTAVGTYRSGSYIDLIYLTGYTLLVFAANSKYKIIKKEKIIS
jgi:hypothetical protein